MKVMTTKEKPPEFVWLGYDFEFNRFGAISVIIIMFACLGGVVQGTGGMQSTAQMLATAIPTMIVLSLILAVQPMKRIVYSAVALCILDIIFIVYNLLT